MGVLSIGHVTIPESFLYFSSMLTERLKHTFFVSLLNRRETLSLTLVPPLSIFTWLKHEPLIRLLLFLNSFQSCLFMEQYVNILSVKTYSSILVNTSCKFMHVLNVPICVNEFILSLFQFL